MVSQCFHLQLPSYTEYLISHSYFFWESLLTTFRWVVFGTNLDKVLFTFWVSILYK